MTIEFDEDDLSDIDVCELTHGRILEALKNWPLLSEVGCDFSDGIYNDRDYAEIILTLKDGRKFYINIRSKDEYERKAQLTLIKPEPVS